MPQNEYYIIERDDNDNYPLFAWDEPSGNFGLGRPIEIQGAVRLCLREPISPNFEWADFHKLPAPVFSQRIANMLTQMDIYGVQLVPAKVRNTKEAPSVEPHDYWFMHVWNRISCLDKELSKLDIGKKGRIWGIKKLVLDDEKLEQIELPERLIFNVAESTRILLIHESIKEAIMSVNPAGCRFFRVSEWNDDATFS
ncbi:imm11 family protein [Vibrio quintilis]|uniref:Immunity MXAN-0049 protein domain-containing protein n=1 Tax=Vibrio quintilis TaxID=1117707 RepID=A0A1M7YZ32_9VIBR|nr:DUF1629 domain-containing protein [Vibrio quintilis]SHO57957.1 hypothetical protein VQ7734_03727 [Vibrio quintilis]